MRIHLLFPLAFLSGVDGFVIFVPYLLLVVATWHISRSRRIAAVIEAGKMLQEQTQRYPAIALAGA